MVGAMKIWNVLFQAKLYDAWDHAKLNDALDKDEGVEKNVVS